MYNYKETKLFQLIFSFFSRKQIICALGDAAAWPIQGLMHYFCPEVEHCISQFHVVNGQVGFGGHLAREVNDILGWFFFCQAFLYINRLLVVLDYEEI